MNLSIVESSLMGNVFRDQKLIIMKDPKIIGKKTNFFVLQELSKKTYKKEYV